MALRATWENTDDGLVVTITDSEGGGRQVELLLGGWAPWEGQAKATTRAVTIIEPDGSRGVRIPLERYEEWLAENFAALLAAGGDERYQATRGHRRRRLMTDEFLQKVAEAYRSAGGIAGITPDVDGRFHASDSQKFRWVKAARERGFLPPRDQ